MKKRFTIAGIGMAAGALLMMMTLNVSADQMTVERAKKIALEHAGAKETDVSLVKAKTEYEDGRLIYEVEFLTKDYQEYGYEINATDGQILKIDWEKKFAYTGNEQKDQTNITLEQAKATAITHVGQTAENITFVKEEMDYEDNRLVYELEFYTADGKWYWYDIDGAGVVTEWEYDAKKYAAYQAMEKQFEEIKTAALKAAGLAAKNVIWGELETDYEDGRLIYEGEFYYSGLKYEFEIDAATGMVLDWDID